MAKLWDDMLKRMFTANPQHFLNWLVPGATLLHELSTELKTTATRDLLADILYAILWKGKKIILHIEFQRRGDKQMGERLWKYNTTTTINSGLDVLSVVIYLRKERKIEEPPYVRKSPDGEPLHIFAYKAFKLWELPAELFLEPDMEGLLPLVTLARDGKRREIVDRMIEGLIASNKTDLLGFAYTFASLAFTKAGESEWLIERFAMYKKELEDSWAYQKILREGREQGIHNTLINFISTRYPLLVDLAKEQINLIRNADELQQFAIKLFSLQTEGEVEECLLALHDDAAKN